LAKRLKSFPVFETIRDGRFFWQTEFAVPETMQTAQGWKDIGDGIFECERPKPSEVVSFARSIEKFGLKVKRKEKDPAIVAPTLEDDDRDEGEKLLGSYQKAQDTVKAAETAKDDAKEDLKDWMKDNAAATNPAHPEARVANIGKFKVHNSYVQGRQTKWDDRDHNGPCEWAIEEGCANEMVQVIVHKTLTYEEFLLQGVPEGFEGSQSVDQDVYDYYVRTGAVPKKVNDVFEARGNPNYAVKIYTTTESSCSNCGLDIKKQAKFCSECGTKQE